MLSNGSEEKNLRTLGSICCQQECKRTWIKSWIDIPLAHMAYIIFLKNAWYCSGSWSYHSSICILSGRDHFNWSDPNHHPGSWLFCTINSLSYWLPIKCMIFFLYCNHSISYHCSTVRYLGNMFTSQGSSSLSALNILFMKSGITFYTINQCSKRRN